MTDPIQVGSTSRVRVSEFVVSRWVVIAGAALIAPGIGYAAAKLTPNQFTWIIGAGVCALVLLFVAQNWRRATWLMLLLLPIWARFLATPAGTFRFDQIVALTGMGLLVANWLLRVRRPIPTSLDRLILLLIFIWVVSGTLMSGLITQLGSLTSEWTWIVTPSRHVPFVRSFTAIGNYLIGLGAYYLVINTLDVPKMLKRGLTLWLIAAAWASLVQVLVFVAYLRGVDLAPQIGGITIPTLLAGEIVPRVGGVGGEPRHLAVLLFSILPFWLYITLNGVYVIRRGWQRTLLLIGLLGLLLTLAKTLVILGGLTILCLFLGQMWLTRSLGATVKVALTVLILLALVMFPFVLLLNAFDLPGPAAVFQALVDGIVQPSLTSTGMQIGFVTAWNMGRAFPVLGVGPDNYQFYVDKFIPLDLVVIQQQLFGIAAPASSPNNAFLALFAETGLVGLGVFCALLLVPLRISIRLVRKSGDQATRVLLIGMILSYVLCFASLATVVGFWFLPYVWIVVGFLVAMQMLAQNSEKITLAYLLEAPPPLLLIPQWSTR